MARHHYRRTHNFVPQHFYYDFLYETQEAYTVKDIASIFEVHPSTAWRKLEGLVHQGKVKKERGEFGIAYSAVE